MGDEARRDQDLSDTSQEVGSPVYEVLEDMISSLEQEKAALVGQLKWHQSEIPIQQERLGEIVKHLGCLIALAAEKREV